MIQKHSYPFARVALGFVLLAGAAGTALGADAPAPAPAAGPGKEVRMQMATLHEQMAACLRSDRPVAECRAEMQKSCQAIGPGQGCMMNGMGPGARMGKGRQGRMGAMPATPTDPGK